MAYLPIGTVVTLVNGRKPIMIYGRKQLQQGSQKVWDYVACLYPEGNLGDEYNIFFQDSEIEKIHHYGLESREDDAMQELLARV